MQIRVLVPWFHKGFHSQRLMFGSKDCYIQKVDTIALYFACEFDGWMVFNHSTITHKNSQ